MTAAGTAGLRGGTRLLARLLLRALFAGDQRDGNAARGAHGSVVDGLRPSIKRAHAIVTTACRCAVVPTAEVASTENRLGLPPLRGPEAVVAARSHGSGTVERGIPQGLCRFIYFRLAGRRVV